MAVKGSTDFDPEEEKEEMPTRHGSIRKVLHSLVGADSLLGKSVKMLDRPKFNATQSEPDDYSPFIREYSLISEYNMVVDHQIPGVYVIPSAKSELLWYGVIFIRSGIYRGGIFRFSLQIPKDFPNCDHPRLMFETRVFHPAIDSNTFHLNLDVFYPWSKKVNRIWQIFDYMKSIFYEIPSLATTNKSAAQLYENARDKYIREVALNVQQSQQDIYNVFEIDDPHYLNFGHYDESTHKETLRALKSVKTCKTNCNSKPGLSWVKKGTLKPFSANPYF